MYSSYAPPQIAPPQVAPSVPRFAVKKDSYEFWNTVDGRVPNALGSKLSDFNQKPVERLPVYSSQDRSVEPARPPYQEPFQPIHYNQFASGYQTTTFPPMSYSAPAPSFPAHTTQYPIQYPTQGPTTPYIAAAYVPSPLPSYIHNTPYTSATYYRHSQAGR